MKCVTRTLIVGVSRNVNETVSSSLPQYDLYSFLWHIVIIDNEGFGMHLLTELFLQFLWNDVLPPADVFVL